MRIACLLMLLAAGSVVNASTNQVSGANTPGPITLGDPFVGEEQRTRFWREYPGAVAGGWQLALRFPTNSFQLGQPITAMVVYKNASTNQLRLYVSPPGLPYMFSARIFYETNKELTMTDQALDQIEDGHSSLSLFRSVFPGDRLAFPFEPDRFYPFTIPGTYQVHVSAHGPLMDAPVPLSTGVAEIKIVPAVPAPATAVTNKLPATNRSVPAGKP